MRLALDFAAPAARPQPVKDGTPHRRETETCQHPKPKPGGPPELAEDYDDGAWM
jgi:hypothetical protein